MTFRQRSNQSCTCGCGEYTFISTSKNNCKPNQYLPGHYSGKKHHNWKNGICMSGEYVLIWQKDHPYADEKGYIRRSHFIVEKAIGKYLPDKAIVHHVDEIRDNDNPKNLVACKDQAYHMLLHQRKRAYNACGHASWRRCNYCKQYDDPKNLYIHPNQPAAWHKECRRKHYNFNKDKYNQKRREQRLNQK